MIEREKYNRLFKLAEALNLALLKANIRLASNGLDPVLEENPLMKEL